VYDSSFVQQTKRVEQLLRKYSHEGRAQTAELVLFDQLVQVDTQKLKDQAQMLFVYECVPQSEQVMVIVLVQLAVQLKKVQKDVFAGEGKLTRSRTDTSIMLWLK